MLAYWQQICFFLYCLQSIFLWAMIQLDNLVSSLKPALPLQMAMCIILLALKCNKEVLIHGALGFPFNNQFRQHHWFGENKMSIPSRMQKGNFDCLLVHSFLYLFIKYCQNLLLHILFWNDILEKKALTLKIKMISDFSHMQLQFIQLFQVIQLIFLDYNTQIHY